jgi:hypothetical protein
MTMRTADRAEIVGTGGYLTPNPSRADLLLPLSKETGVSLRDQALGDKRPEPPFRAVSARAGHDP